MRLRIAALALLPVLSTGCEFFNEPEQGRAGFVSFSALASGPDFVANPIGAFYGTSNLDFSLADPGTCATRPYVASSENVSLPSVNTVDAGPYVFLDQPARRDTLSAIVQFQYRLYRKLTGVVPIVPGDPLTVTVSGGPGFPAVDLSVLMAEGFTISDPVVPVENEPLTLTWSVPTEPGSLMSVALRYSRADTPGQTNEQLICAFEDTGTATIPGSFLSLWRASAEEDREFVATRVRTATTDAGANGTLTLITTFSVPTPILQ